jgi:hypothetical protein
MTPRALRAIIVVMVVIILVITACALSYAIVRQKYIIFGGVVERRVPSSEEHYTYGTKLSSIKEIRVREPRDDITPSQFDRDGRIKHNAPQDLDENYESDEEDENDDNDHYRYNIRGRQMLALSGVPATAIVLNASMLRERVSVPPSSPIIVLLSSVTEMDAARDEAAPYIAHNLHYVVVDRAGDTGALLIAAGIDIGVQITTRAVPGATPATGWLYDSSSRFINYINPARYDVAKPIR